MRTCSKCKTIKPFHAFNKRTRLKDGCNSYCRECARDTANGFYRKTKEQQADYRVKRLYKLNDEQFAHWKSNSGGPCELCGKSETSGKRLTVDHDHVTGLVRGLVCRACNVVNYADDAPMLRARIAWLERHASEFPPDSAWACW